MFSIHTMSLYIGWLQLWWIDLPVRHGKDDFFVIFAGIRIGSVVDDHGAAQAIWVLSHVMRVIYMFRDSGQCLSSVYSGDVNIHQYVPGASTCQSHVSSMPSKVP